jgi:hypothetical protein
MSKPDTEAPPKIVIEVDDKLAFTVDQAAAKYGIKRRSMNSVIERHGIPVAGMLDGNKKVYLAADIERVMATRPGHGWRAGKGYQFGEPS